jgi:ribose transport system ATP-binding protein
VEIARNLIGDCHVLILDEPTAMLTTREVEMLFEQITRLQARGVAIIYISHRLEELARVAQRIAVLRDGCLVCVEPMANYNSEQLVNLMVGRELGEHIDLGPRQIGAVALTVQGLTRSDKVRDVSFEVRSGEIFGISGLIGAGRTELLRLIFGADTADSGTVALGSPAQVVSIRSPADAVGHGIALITEDRKGEGLLLTQSISANIALGNMPVISSGGIVNAGDEIALCQRQIDAMGIRSSGPAQLVSELSGGNQQKVVLGKWLATNPKVIILDEPTKGIDIGSKEAVHRFISQLVAKGLSVILVSSELPEVLGLADRVIVMHQGHISKEFARAEATPENVVAAASGLALAEKEVA